MKVDFQEHRDIWGPLFTIQLQNWAEYVIKPAIALQQQGYYVPAEWGTAPASLQESSSHPIFSKNGIQLHLLSSIPADYQKIKYFDAVAEEYQMAADSFKKPLLQLLLPIIKKYIAPSSRIADIGCGPGYEAIELSKMAYKNEVVCVDLSAEMIRLAYRNAKEKTISNISFHQFDAEVMPSLFYNKFDGIFCQFSFIYFQNPTKVADNFFQLLKNGGIVFLVHPDKSVANQLSFQSAKAAMPSLVSYYNKEDINAIFSQAGFVGYYWRELVPGIGLSIIQK
jgi:ubiquinone/menaquinone biosynthesis C-methylase UbiE